MANTNSRITIGINEILQGISALETTDLELFYKKVADLLASRKAPILSNKETELFLIINSSPFNEEEQNRYTFLYKKLQEETIIPEQHVELKRLIQQQETYGVIRLKALVELAQIRKISLEKLMLNLGIENITPNVETEA